MVASQRAPVENHQHVDWRQQLHRRTNSVGACSYSRCPCAPAATGIAWCVWQNLVVRADPTSAMAADPRTSATLTTEWGAPVSDGKNRYCIASPLPRSLALRMLHEIQRAVLVAPHCAL